MRTNSVNSEPMMSGPKMMSGRIIVSQPSQTTHENQGKDQFQGGLILA
jgi:hypothetical protein